METKTLTKEVAPIELLCDACHQEIHTGEIYFSDHENGKVYCPSCEAKEA